MSETTHTCRPAVPSLQTRNSLHDTATRVTKPTQSGGIKHEHKSDKFPTIRRRKPRVGQRAALAVAADSFKKWQGMGEQRGSGNHEDESSKVCFPGLLPVCWPARASPRHDLDRLLYSRHGESSRAPRCSRQLESRAVQYIYRVVVSSRRRGSCCGGDGRWAAHTLVKATTASAVARTAAAEAPTAHPLAQPPPPGLRPPRARGSAPAEDMVGDSDVTEVLDER